MALNGSGTHVRVMDWTQDLANTIPVTAARMDQEHDDISSTLSMMIARDGQSTTTARIPFASGLSAAAGTTSSVSYAQTNDNNTGMYFPATDQWGLVAGGVATLTSTATTVTVPVAFAVTGAITGSSTIAGTDITGSGALSGATAAGAMIATEAQQETGTATNLLVTPGRQHFHHSAAKAWGTANAAGVISEDYGVATVTDVDVGKIDWNWTTAFTTSTYAPIPSALISEANRLCTIDSKSTSATRVRSVDAGGTLSDPTFWHVAAFGVI